MLKIKKTGHLLLTVAAGIFVLGVVVFWWLTVKNPRIAFLARHGQAEWILYPTPPDGVTHGTLELSTSFHQSFSLDRAPERATLAVRAFRHCVLTVNGMEVGKSPAAGKDWKQAAEFDVSQVLHAGTNEIAVTVFCDNAPPALWLSLEADGRQLNSDGDWDTSFVGAAWHKARLAEQPPEIRVGNPMFGGEDVVHAVGRNWATLLLWMALTAWIVLAMRRQIQVIRISAPEGEQDEVVGRKFNQTMLFAMAAVAVLWAGLFLNNLHQIPGRIGYDVSGHLEYIDFIRVHHTLPFANEGWEMQQPPLYYLINAGMTWPLKANTPIDEVITWFRSFGLVAGIVHIWLIFLSLKLLFPGRAGMQLAGLLLAAFIPEQLYLSQYITNEPLAGVFVSATIYFCIRLMIGHRAPWRLAAAAGACLGAGLLTKVTAILAVPFTGGALVVWLWQKRRSDIRAWASVLGTFVVTCFGICGWYYIRVWRHFGTPFMNNWDPKTGFMWWQDEGFHTGAYFLRFGECLSHPFYSAFHGFADGLYSSFWGDSMYGSAVTFMSRTPWNYDLMAVGFWLALVPTGLILTGAVVGLRRLLRRPDPAWFLLIGLCAAALAALVYINLKLPYYGSVKAFYMFVALLPVCAFGALGWNVCNRVDSRLGLVAGILLGAWAINAYATFWVRDHSASTHVMRGIVYTSALRSREAQVEFTKALRLEPNDSRIAELGVSALYRQKRFAEARQWTEQLLQADPQDAEAHMLLGQILFTQGQGQWDSAVQHLKRAIALAPDYGAAYKLLVPWLELTDQYQETVDVGREALRVLPYDSQIHSYVGKALSKLGREDEARWQLQLASDLLSKDEKEALAGKKDTK